MFKRIQASNFQSWKDLDFTIQEGITLIQGKNLDDGNSEGCGKSAIVNSLCWGLYGALPKDTNIDDVIREGEKGCVVTIELSSGIKVVRSRKPNDFYVLESEGSEPLRGKDAKETQSIVNELLGLSFETFCQAGYFAQNDTNRFILASEPEKVRILSEIRDLAKFDKAAKKAGELAKTTEQELTRAKLECEKLSNAAHLYSEQLKSYVEMKEKQERDNEEKFTYYAGQKLEIIRELKKLEKVDTNTEELSAQKEQLKADIKILNDEIVKLKVQQAGLNSIKTLIASKKQNLSMLTRQTDTLLRQIESQKKKDTCGTCGSKLTGKSKEEIDQHIVGLEEQAVELRAQGDQITVEVSTLIAELDSAQTVNVAEYQDGITTAQRQINDIDAKLVEIASVIPKKANLEKEYLRLDKEQATLKSTVTFDLKISESARALETAKNAYSTQSDKVSEISNKQRMFTELKDHFKQVKLYVFQSTIDELNYKANQYLQELFEVPASITLSNTSEDGEVSKMEVVVTLDGAERSLGMLSGGQFRRVCLAVDLSLSDIIATRNTNAVDLIIFDEYFKDLSLESMVKIKKLLATRKGTILMIEHNELFKQSVENQFDVVLENGVSRAA